MTEVAGVELPDSAMCTAVTEFVKLCSEPFLFHHVMRCFVLADLIGVHRDMSYDRELLYISAVMHDLGLTRKAPVQQRFEVEGADAARDYLSKQGMKDRDLDIVWDAIALHTTAEIPLKKAPEIALCHLGISADVGIAPLGFLPEGVLDAVLDAYPSLSMSTAMPDKLVSLYQQNAAAAASNAVADACERRVPGFRRFNFCDFLTERTAAQG
jgi:hypothetical protein